MFHPTAEPSNPVVWDLPDPTDIPREPTAEQARIQAHIEDRMDLHRAFLRNLGFYNWMTKASKKDFFVDADKSRAGLRALPVVNFLDIGNKAYADAIVRRLSPKTVAASANISAVAPLDLELSLLYGSGTGRMAGTAVVLAMEAKCGKILCSAPTNVACDKFAAHIDKRTRDITMDCNKDKEKNDRTRFRHKFVVRAYNPRHEVAAFESLLQRPHHEVASAKLDEEYGWKLHLSLAFWLLALVGSPAVRRLRLDDSDALWALRRSINDDVDFERLQGVATGILTWAQYSARPVAQSVLESYMEKILECTDILCTTPAATHNFKPLRLWKNNLAKGVAIDDAATMNRADLYCVWGNTLLPCFLFGEQLPPTVITAGEQDADGNFVNRFARSSHISALLFFRQLVFQYTACHLAGSPQSLSDVAPG
ncbi:hypothetical protein PT974_09875 [Cladobotryum mycophilum]|uniref:DNA2/NAM7 helicase helicase domain-containing protein n=1 Tax=Cladobotryum mycophilum TaxID=491253 RepID=A0ABR0SIL2_9HYPO